MGRDTSDYVGENRCAIDDSSFMQVHHLYASIYPASWNGKMAILLAVYNAETAIVMRTEMAELYLTGEGVLREGEAGECGDDGYYEVC